MIDFLVFTSPQINATEFLYLVEISYKQNKDLPKIYCG